MRAIKMPAQFAAGRAIFLEQGNDIRESEEMQK
jgi:hypothetical protein